MRVHRALADGEEAESLRSYRLREAGATDSVIAVILDQVRDRRAELLVELASSACDLPREGHVRERDQPEVCGW